MDARLLGRERNGGSQEGHGASARGRTPDQNDCTCWKLWRKRLAPMGSISEIVN